MASRKRTSDEGERPATSRALSKAAEFTPMAQALVGARQGVDSRRSASRSTASSPQKPLALELGLEPDGAGGFVDEDGDLRTADGQGAEVPRCAVCRDARYVKVRPVSRASRGSWDWDLTACPECGA